MPTLGEGWLHLATSWWQWVVAVSVQVAVLALLVLALDLVLDRLFRGRVWPQLRAALWLLVVLKLVVPPTLTSPVSISRLGDEVALAGALAAPVSTGGGAAGLAPWFFAAWWAGFLLLGGTMFRRYRRLRRAWLGRSQPAPAWLQQMSRRAAERLGCPRTDLRLVPGLRGPAVLGFWRPVVVLPAELASGASREQLDHVLLHELAHVRRRDPVVSLCCTLLQLVYWFHPVVWFARRRLATLREICCDLTVARVLDSATPRYRRTLLELARPLLEDGGPDRRMVPGLGFIHGHSQLMARLTWLERPLARRPRLRRLVTTLVVTVVMACCVPLQPERTGGQASPRGVASLGIPSLRTARDLADLPGCLQRRYAVLGLMAAQDPPPEQE